MTDQSTKAALEPIQEQLRKDAQNIGAAISNQNWQAVERAYNTIRDRIDAWSINLNGMTPNTDIAYPPAAEPVAWICEGVPDAVIEAGIEAWESARVEMDDRDKSDQPEAYTDWDDGMIVAAIFKAMCGAIPNIIATPLPPPPAGDAERVVDEARDRIIMASARLGRWMSAALDDPAVCEEMKAAIREWFSAGEPIAPVAGDAELRKAKEIISAFVKYLGDDPWHMMNKARSFLATPPSLPAQQGEELRFAYTHDTVEFEHPNHGKGYFFTPDCIKTMPPTVAREDHRDLLSRCERQLSLKLGASPLLREIRAALATPPSVPAQQGWLPIETAPKDGSTFLGYHAEVDGRTGTWFALVDYSGDEAWPWEDGEGKHHDGFLTHWMPLPATPPAQDQKGDSE